MKKVNWNNRTAVALPDMKVKDGGWAMDTMPFQAVCKGRLTDAYPIQYLAEGKYVSFAPVGALPVKGKLSSSKHRIIYRDGLGAGISIEVRIARDNWHKLVKIDSLASLGDISGKAFVEFSFEVNTNFTIPKRKNTKSKIKLGEDCYIKVPGAWDSRPPTLNEAGVVSHFENSIPIKGFFERVDGMLYYRKQIPTAWLRTATFPVVTDLNITLGTASEFEAQSALLAAICTIDTNKIAVCWANWTTMAGHARVATISGTTFTWGAEVTLNADVSVAGAQMGICKVATDKFAVIYSDEASGDNPTIRVCTVATRTITMGAETVLESTDSAYVGICQLGTDKIACVYDDNTNTDGKAVVCTIATRTPTVGPPIAFYGGNTAYCHCCKLDTDKFAVAYRQYDGDDPTYVVACTVATRTITVGTPLSVGGTDDHYQHITQLGTDKFLVMWLDNADTSGQMSICTVSTRTITEGVQKEFDADAILTPHAVKIDGDRFILVYTETNLYSRLCSYSGTTITLGAEELILNGANYAEIALISFRKVVVVYRDEADAGDVGEAIVGDIPRPTPVTDGDLIGIPVIRKS